MGFIPARQIRGPVAGTVSVIVTACMWSAPALAQTFSERTLPFGSSLMDPQGLAVDSAGDLFATNFSSVSGSVVELPANGSGGYGSATLLPFGNTLAGASAVAVDSTGDVFVANQVAGTVVELPANRSGGYGSPIILPLTTSTNGPDGIAVDAAGDVFVANYDSDSVIELVAPAAKSTAGPARVIQLPFGTSLHDPMGVAVDSAGDVFTASSSDNTVLELRPNHSGGYDPPTTLPFGTSLDLPSGVAVDPAGDLFVPNANSNTIVELPANGAGGHGLPITLPVRGSLGFPAGLAVDAAGQVFVLPKGQDAGSAVELSPSAPSVPPANSPQLNAIRTGKSTTCPLTCTYRPPANDQLVSGAPAEAIATIGHHRQVIGTGSIRNGTLAMTFMQLSSGHYRVDLIQLRSDSQPLLIGHTALVIG